MPGYDPTPIAYAVSTPSNAEPKRLFVKAFSYLIMCFGLCCMAWFGVFAWLAGSWSLSAISLAAKHYLITHELMHTLITGIVFLFGSGYFAMKLAKKENSDDFPYGTLLKFAALPALMLGPILAIYPTLSMMAGLGTLISVLLSLMYVASQPTFGSAQVNTLLTNNMLIGIILFDLFAAIFHAPIINITACIAGIILFSVLLTGNLSKAMQGYEYGYGQHAPMSPNHVQVVKPINPYLLAADTFLIVVNIFVRLIDMLIQLNSESSDQKGASIGAFMTATLSIALVLICALTSGLYDKENGFKAENFSSFCCMLAVGALLTTLVIQPHLLTVSPIGLLAASSMFLLYAILKAPIRSCFNRSVSLNNKPSAPPLPAQGIPLANGYSTNPSAGNRLEQDTPPKGVCGCW